jgi:hypothetical protein
VNASEAFRERCKQLDDAELARRLYLISLVQRLDAELQAFMVLCGSGEEPLHLMPAPDAKLTSMLHLMQAELKRRVAATIKRQIGHTEGESAHEQNGTH